MDDFEVFSEHFCIIEDNRAERSKRHILMEILFIALCAMLSGAENFPDMERFGNLRIDWLSKYLKLPYGIPSHDTFERVFRVIDSKAFIDCFMKWAASLRELTGGSVIAIDGKTIRKSFDTWGGKSAMHVVGAWATEAGLALGHVVVDSKSNEITAIPELIEKLCIKGHTVTMDAMGCQKDIAKQIVDKGGDYLLCAKGNQGGLYESISEFFRDCEDFKDVEHTYFSTLEKEHGRIEERKCWAVEGEAKWLGLDKDWKNIRTIAMIERKRTIRRKTSTEMSYYITSLPGDAKRIALSARSHWAIENSQHWVLDVTMNEDMSRARKDNAAINLATLRRVAINMINLVKGKWSVRGSMKAAGWDVAFLERILAGPT
jgi:predicted transposase YbfD/YdcC